MPKLIMSVAILATLWSSVAAQSLTGSYRVSGTSPKGVPYEGTARIAISSHGSCRIHWLIESTELNAAPCFHKGSKVTAVDRRDGHLVRFVYELKPNGSLDGSWTMGGAPGRGIEVLTPHHK